MFKTGICGVLYISIIYASFQVKAEEAFKLLPPTELAVTSQIEPDEVELVLSQKQNSMTKKVPDTQVYSWPLYYKTHNMDDALAYIEARCVSEPSHAKDMYMSGFLSGLYAKKKRQCRIGSILGETASERVYTVSNRSIPPITQTGRIGSKAA